MTLNQLIRRREKSQQRLRKFHYNRTKHLKSSPQRKATCLKVYITKPKKPNSALRKIAKVALTIRNSFRVRKLLVAIPGQGHSLQKFSVVLIRGGRTRDIPGVRYKMIRGVHDFITAETFKRTQRRSFYGIKKPKEEFYKFKFIKN